MLYGERGLVAIEVKRSARFREEDLAGLRLFGEDYPMARRILLYGGQREYQVEGMQVLPVAPALQGLREVLG